MNDVTYEAECIYNILIARGYTSVSQKGYHIQIFKKDNTIVKVEY